MPERMEPVAPEDLRAEFLRLLTTDSRTKDRRRREFNRALFISAPGDVYLDGKPVWTETTLDMVMEKFDKAVRNTAELARGKP